MFLEKSVNQLRDTRQRFPVDGVNLFRMDYGSHKSQITVIETETETETETVRLKLIFNEVRFIIMYILLYIYNIYIIYI